MQSRTERDPELRVKIVEPWLTLKSHAFMQAARVKADAGKVDQDTRRSLKTVKDGVSVSFISQTCNQEDQFAQVPFWALAGLTFKCLRHLQHRMRIVIAEPRVRN